MNDRATHEMVVRFIREFQERQEEWAKQLLAIEGRVHAIEGRMNDIEALAKNFSGRLNGMESRLEDRAKQASVDAILDAMRAHDKAIVDRFEALQAANKALRDWIYNQDFDREFALVNALEATL